MIPLSKIPEWMEKYIPMITNNGCTNEADLRSKLDVIAASAIYGENHAMISVSQINTKIELLIELEKKHLI